MLTQVRRLAPAVGLATHLGHGVQRIATDGTIGHVRALPRRIAADRGPAVPRVRIRPADRPIRPDSRGSRRRAERVPRHRASARRVPGRVGRGTARPLDRPPHTVTHGDAHPGSVYFRDGAAGLLDWQAVRRGHPGRELAYTLITSMTDRQATERDLLDRYRHALAAAGGPALDADELWERYRLGALYAYTAAVITAGVGGMQTEDIALEGTRRAVAALADLDTVALLKKLL
ncbi:MULTISPECIES: phosphotransferase [unclassified Mycolicibacterium]|uniref:phosphotransferase n=1 Tax=unclassified Mycolicibacterium TaxID=2636767 RepID=UPI002ED78436